MASSSGTSSKRQATVSTDQASPSQRPRKQQACDPPPPPRALELHPWLQFSANPEESRRLSDLRGKNFESNRTIDWGTLKAICVADRVKDMIGDVWFRFFSLQDTPYKELCLEFFSTYKFVTPCTDYKDDGAITFRLGGQERKCSLIDFARRMDLYTDAEMETDLFLSGSTDMLSDLETTEFWSQIGQGVYEKKNTKATMMHDPLHRLLHHIISHSISGRKDSGGHVTPRDLYFLHCFIHQATCNVAYALANHFTTCKGIRQSSSICGGSYVTHLAKSFGILPPTDANVFLTALSPTQLVNMVVLRNMRLVQDFSGIGTRLVDSQGKPYQPPQQLPPDQHEPEHVSPPPPQPKPQRRPSSRAPDTEIRAMLVELLQGQQAILAKQRRARVDLDRILQRQDHFQETLRWAARGVYAFACHLHIYNIPAPPPPPPPQPPAPEA